jgi:hypothetical protein
LVFPAILATVAAPTQKLSMESHLVLAKIWARALGVPVFTKVVAKNPLE